LLFAVRTAAALAAALSLSSPALADYKIEVPAFGGGTRYVHVSWTGSRSDAPCGADTLLVTASWTPEFWSGCGIRSGPRLIPPPEAFQRLGLNLQVQIDPASSYSASGQAPPGSPYWFVSLDDLHRENPAVIVVQTPSGGLILGTADIWGDGYSSVRADTPLGAALVAAGAAVENEQVQVSRIPGGAAVSILGPAGSGEVTYDAVSWCTGWTTDPETQLPGECISQEGHAVTVLLPSSGGGGGGGYIGGMWLDVPKAEPPVAASGDEVLLWTGIKFAYGCSSIWFLGIRAGWIPGPVVQLHPCSSRLPGKDYIREGVGFLDAYGTKMRISAMPGRYSFYFRAQSYYESSSIYYDSPSGWIEVVEPAFITSFTLSPNPAMKGAEASATVKTRGPVDQVKVDAPWGSYLLRQSSPGVWTGTLPVNGDPGARMCADFTLAAYAYGPVFNPSRQRKESILRVCRGAPSVGSVRLSPGRPMYGENTLITVRPASSSTEIASAKIEILDMRPEIPADPYTPAEPNPNYGRAVEFAPVTPDWQSGHPYPMGKAAAMSLSRQDDGSWTGRFAAGSWILDNQTWHVLMAGEEEVPFRIRLTLEGPGGRETTEWEFALQGSRVFVVPMPWVY